MSDTQSRVDSWNERISKLEEANNDHLVRIKKPEDADNDLLTRIKKLEQDVTAQHRLHSTSWYKDVKKLEDIVNRDRKRRCICQDNGIFLLEVWYDENPEIVIPERIQKIKDFVVTSSNYTAHITNSNISDDDDETNDMSVV
ncbi:932_t:CDS:2 [Diversispora eburnea]|uniref:932_t:CDS:1 n=1 Tax=Diversispora eburnea TaxID=1213867 RepID=A0A9N9GM76_9GLOM|nr:932_t:CDS:2 [Diversispora eburnea]